jgi:hypothetical protein
LVLKRQLMYKLLPRRLGFDLVMGDATGACFYSCTAPLQILIPENVPYSLSIPSPTLSISILTDSLINKYVQTRRRRVVFLRGRNRVITYYVHELCAHLINTQNRGPKEHQGTTPRQTRQTLRR